MARFSSRFSRYARATALSASAAILGAVLFLTVSWYLKPVHAETNPQDAVAAANALKLQLEITEKRLEDIQKLLAELIATGGVFAFAAGVFSYFNFKEQKESAQEQMKKLERDFPAIAGLNERMERVSQDISDDGIVMFDGWDKESYRDLSERSRENIRMNEVVFSALELFDLSKSPELTRHATEIHIAFGRFHGSHYFFDSTNEAAVERAKIYFRKAIQSRDATMRERALSDLGVVCCWHADNIKSDPIKAALMTEAKTEARRSFDLACAIRSYNPAALIGRAWLKRRDNDLAGAIQDLGELVGAFEEKKLSDEERRRYVPTGYFNRACYRVIDAHGKPDKAAAYRNALDDLWKYKAVAIDDDIFADFLADLDRELPAGKDLHPLEHGHTPELKDLRDRTKVHP